MSAFLFIVVLITVIWFYALLGKERRERRDFEGKVLATFADSGLREYSFQKQIDQLIDAHNKAVTPEAFDALHQAHLDLVERHACIARKTSTLPG